MGRKGWGRGKDGKEEGMGRRKGWGGGSVGEEEGIGRKRQDGRRVDRIREDRIMMAGWRDRDDGKPGFAWYPC